MKVQKKQELSHLRQKKGALAGIWTRDLCLTKATLTASLITMKLFHWRPRQCFIIIAIVIVIG
jgi:hypothetical protein